MNSRKFHAIVICVLIGSIFIIWEFSAAKPAQKLKEAPKSPYTIDIYRATYGLACKDFYDGYYQGRYGNDVEFVDPYGDQKAQIEKNLKENNVLEAVKGMCDGKPGCAFNVKPSSFAFDPFPDCQYKDLRIDFRCYDVDRLRRLISQEGEVAVIDCNKIFN